MADFDFASLGNLFSGGGLGGMGGTPSGLDALLSEDQRKLLGRNATLSAAAALLQASGRSATPISLGQALGGALQAGQGSYEKGRASSFQDLLVGQKLTEAKDESEFNKRMRAMLMPAAAGILPPAAGGQVPLPPAAIDGPGVQVFAPDAPRAVAPAQPGAIRPGGMFANLSPEQRAIAAFNPKVMLPKIFEESLKTDTFRPMTKEEIKARGLDPRNLYELNTRTNEPKIFSKYEGVFGGGLQGSAYDILLTKEPNTPEYALAYRALSQPVPVEKLQPDGSVRTVYEQPAPLPTSFERPSYRGKLPAAKPTGGAQMPAGGAMPGGAPTPAQAAPGGPMEAQPGGFAGTGAKSSPFAPTPGQVTDARKQALTIEKLMGSVNALEANVRENGMQIGGMGPLGAAQEALFQDSILQLKELQNLGVLQGRDETLLIQQFSNPTSLMTYIKGLGGPEYFFAKVKELKSKAERELAAINRQFPVPVTGQQPVAPAMPQRFTVPPGLGDILKRYPGAGG